MPKRIHFVCFLVVCVILFICFCVINLNQNVNFKFGPRLLTSNLRNLRSSDESMTGVTPFGYIQHGGRNQNTSSIVWKFLIPNTLSSKNIHLASIFCNVAAKSPLELKFRHMFHSLTKYCNRDVTLHFHFITDSESWKIGKPILLQEAKQFQLNIKVSLYLIDNFAHAYKEMIGTMQKYFSAKPGTYYSQALFYVSVRLPDILPLDVIELIFIDVDTQFQDDVVSLHSHFNNFDQEQMLGLAPELSPVYRHILYMYRNQHKTSLLGNPRGSGFPGYNSGVILMRLDRLRKSDLYHSLMNNSSIYNLTSKYNFKGHLGDQDFYTLIALEYPQLFYTLPCNWNRQLCQWWKSRGYEDIFDDYFQCKGFISLYHGNCNTPFPNET